MKKAYLLMSLASFFLMLARAQSNESGLYLTQRDFENKRLSYSPSASEADKINFHEFFYKPYVTVRKKGEKTIVFKDELFAYQKKGKIVRTSNFVPYTFAEKGAIWIYYRDENVFLGKGIKRERTYYYSVSGKDKVVPLTVGNLKRSFPDKHLFHHFLDAQFKRDSHLSLYDSFQKKFKVNHLLQTTVFGTLTVN